MSLIKLYNTSQTTWSSNTYNKTFQTSSFIKSFYKSTSLLTIFSTEQNDKWIHWLSIYRVYLFIEKSAGYSKKCSFSAFGLIENLYTTTHMYSFIRLFLTLGQSCQRFTRFLFLKCAWLRNNPGLRSRTMAIAMATMPVQHTTVVAAKHIWLGFLDGRGKMWGHKKFDLFAFGSLALVPPPLSWTNALVVVASPFNIVSLSAKVCDMLAITALFVHIFYWTSCCCCWWRGSLQVVVCWSDGAKKGLFVSFHTQKIQGLVFLLLPWQT